MCGQTPPEVSGQDSAITGAHSRPTCSLNLANWIAETGITAYHSVAAVWRELLAGLIDPGLLSSLRLVRLGGGPSAPDDAAVLQRLPQHCQVWTNYAATEHWVGLYSLVDSNTRLDQGLPHIPLRTARRLLSSHSPPIGWSRLAAGGAEVRMVPGMHEEIFMEPHVRTLATEVGAALASARAEVGSG